MFRSIVISTILLLACSALFGQATNSLAPGAPGLDVHGSATPLAWSMAQFIRLAINISEGHKIETPTAVAARYLKGSAKN
jgi:hypothetical protein